MRTGSAGSVRRSASARSAPTSIVGHVAGRSARCRAIRSSSSGSPGHAVARNHARPSPASRCAAASPNRLFPLRVPPSARISGCATRLRAGRCEIARHGARSRRRRASRPAPVRRSPRARRRRAARARRRSTTPASDPTTQRRSLPRRSGIAEPATTAATATMATPVTTANDARRACRPARRTRTPRPPVRGARPRQPRQDDGHEPRHGPGHDARRRAEQRTGRRQARERGHLRAQDEDQRDGAARRRSPGPCGRCSARPGRATSSASAVSARPSRWSAPETMAITATAATAARSGSPGPRSTTGTAPRRPTTAPTSGERRRARRVQPGRADRRGASGARTPREARPRSDGRLARSPHDRRRRRPSSGRADRQADEGRVDAEDVADVAVVERSRRAARRRRSGRRPSTTIRGKKWAARARSCRTATIVVPSRSLRSTSSSMTSTWWRMSRWAVGSSSTRIGAAWARAIAMKTSWRSPIDSSRASRWRRWPTPTRSIAAVDGRTVGRSGAAERRLVGQPTERHDVVDAHLERQLGELRHDRDRAGHGPALERRRSGRRPG